MGSVLHYCQLLELLTRIQNTRHVLYSISYLFNFFHHVISALFISPVNNSGGGMKVHEAFQPDVLKSG